MPWRKPEYDGDFPSLGWDLIDWYREYLTVPSGPMVGQPLELTDEQAAFIVRFYRLDPKTGRRVYRRGVLRRPKGWGKSPALAAFAIGELCGPVTFGGWDADGDVVGVAHASPWVQIAACSEDQTDNTYVSLFEMLRGSSAVDEFNLDVGITRIFLTGRPGRLEPVTASSGSREGQLVTAAVMDETHLWLPNNGGTKLAATIRRNVAKMDGTTIESTNAYIPGLGSVAEQSETARSKGQKGLLLDIGPQVELTVEEISNKRKAKKALKEVYGDSKWVDLERIYEDATDADTDPIEALRFYWNVIHKSTEQAFDPKRWAELVDAKKVVPDKALITLGFDGARFHDATALIATDVESGHQWPIDIWERPDNAGDDWEVDEADVEGAIEQAFDTYNVWRLYADPPYWETAVKTWVAKWGEQRVMAWWTNRNRQMAYALLAYSTAQRAGDLSHDGNTVFARHLANARRRNTRIRDESGRMLWVIQKEHPNSPNKIDAAMAGCLSWEARSDAIEAGALKRRRSIYEDRGLEVV